MGLSFTFQRVEDLNSDASSVFVVLVLSSSEFVNVSIFELTAEPLGGHENDATATPVRLVSYADCFNKPVMIFVRMSDHKMRSTCGCSCAGT